ncbi:MAG: hypothetical protein CSA24_00790 [Deltaproteobacteria bacterium]|nr:MAG: hypothetical protein CSA24_00790 [Deltaproteobacteria bacterium]
MKSLISSMGSLVVAVSLLCACSGRGAGQGVRSSAGSTRETPRSRRLPRRKPPWYRDISKAKLADDSKRTISWLASQGGGWGRGRFQIDSSMHVLTATRSTPYRRFETTDDFYSPDCDHVPMPVPAGGAIEGETGYRCESDGDCHLLVFDPYRKRLYEMWRADIRGGTFHGGCLAVWDLRRAYGPSGRGHGCTSADAAGLPIAPLLARPDAVAAGAVKHALRFILPNPRIRRQAYVSPATHSTNATSGGRYAPPYGARFRLRRDFPVQTLKSKGARVLARTLQRYGMFLADAGSITLTVQSDRGARHKWEGLLGPHDLRPLKVTDFEVVAHGAVFPYDGECERR